MIPIPLTSGYGPSTCWIQIPRSWSSYASTACKDLDFWIGYMPNAYPLIIARALNLGAVGTPRFPKVQLSLPSRSYPRQIQMDNGHCDTSRGALIVLEGLDRCGKTSQSSRLLAYLEGKGFAVESWRFPDRTTCVGEMISSYLANKSHLDDRTIHLLFSANRWEKRSLMETKLKSGTTLVVDRYSYSGVAFSAAKGLDIEWCKAPEMGLLAPDLVVYLDIQPEKAAERGGYGGERYEQLEFQRKVAQHYHLLRDDTWKIVDACLPMENVEQQLRELALECISTCRKGKPVSLLWSQ
ncbi:thymidylate kinase isoform X2 [Magnolia sinica]|uniref:thymidylate kinase isoform X2 n=1 Tax=Magnolia sinica TaxID=86752 RepID=UPI002659F0EC|nr:thymidylate kinase isoform X2 [Magnolia sinica]